MPGNCIFAVYLKDRPETEKMHYNFDEIIDRRNTDCYKYDLRQKYFNRADVLPMWVADMDLRTPDFIINAISQRLEHEILGYSYHAEAEYKSITRWMLQRHHWKISEEWIGFAPGVVPSICFALLTYTEPGDKIIIQTPVYFPFYSVVNDHNRELTLNPLVEENGRYRMDLDDLKSKIDKRTRMLILCNPHNPTGNVWTREELNELASICIENNILILSDEIHSDIIYEGFKHVPAATISDDVANITITLMAPSKTFNMAALSTSFYIISNRHLRDIMNAVIDKYHLSTGNLLGNVALEAAYSNGADWLDQLLIYLRKNVDLARKFINSEIPILRMFEPEATFLLWIDFRQTGLDDDTINRLLIGEANVGLSSGKIFGREGEGFQRINIGCPRPVLKEGLDRIAHVFSKRT